MAAMMQRFRSLSWPPSRGSTPTTPAMARPILEHKEGTVLSEKGVVGWKGCGSE